MLLLSSLSFNKRKLLRWYSTFKIGLLVHEKHSKKFKNSGLKKTGKNLLFVLNKSVVFIHSSKYAAIISYPIRCKNKHQIPICLKKLIFKSFTEKMAAYRYGKLLIWLRTGHQNDSQYYVQLTRKEINSKKNCQSGPSYNIFFCENYIPCQSNTRILSTTLKSTN